MLAPLDEWSLSKTDLGAAWRELAAERGGSGCSPARVVERDARGAPITGTEHPVDGDAWNPAVPTPSVPAVDAGDERNRLRERSERTTYPRREHARGSFYAPLARPSSGGPSVVRKYCANRRTSSRSIGDSVAAARVGSGNDSASTAS